MSEPYKQIFQSAGCGMLLLDTQGLVVDYNSAALSFLGRERANVAGRPFNEILPGANAAAIHELVEQTVNQGCLVHHLAAGKPGPSLLLVLSVVPWQDESAILVILQEAPAGMLSADEQVWMRQGFLVGSEDGERAFFLLDEDGEVEPFPPRRKGEERKQRPLYWMDVIVTGPRLEEPLKLAWQGHRQVLPPAWYYPDEDLTSERLTQTAFAQGDRSQDRFLYVEFMPLRDRDGKPLRVLALVEDRTPMRLKEERQRKREWRSTLMLFSNALLQELNNHLGAILAQASALKLSTPPGQMVPPALGAIQDSAQDAAALLRRCSELGQDVDDAWKQVNLNAPVAEAARLMAQHQQNGVEVDLKLGHDLPLIRGDAKLLELLILAVAQTAMDDLPAGGMVRIETARVPSTSPAVSTGAEMTITHPGCVRTPGTTVDALASLAPSDPAEKGDPLAQAIAHAILRQHRGQCTVACDSQEGTIWRLLFPGIEVRPNLTGPTPHLIKPDTDKMRMNLEAAAAQPVELPDTPGETDDGGAGEDERGCILLADDEENFRDFGRGVLEQAGYHVLTASDGQEAFDLFQESPSRFALVVLDAYMPRLGGLETYLRMQAQRPGLPVLFVSGFVRGPSRDALVAGCPGRADVVLKPFSSDQLLEAVSRMTSSA